MNLQLVQIYTIKGKIELVSGLRVGAGDSEMHIGGVDQTTIKDPFTGNPYIPGSSIKGKLRSLLEQASGASPITDGKPLNHTVLENQALSTEQKKFSEGILKLFGFMNTNQGATNSIGPTRISISDALFDTEWEKIAITNQWPKTEVKPETAINRIKGTAENGTLRSIERIPAGTRFAFQINVKLFDASEKESLVDKLLLPGLKLIEQDYLGGMGSRGYGRVKFHFSESALQSQFDSLDPFQFFPKR